MACAEACRIRDRALPAANAIANHSTDRNAGRAADRAARVDADCDIGAYQHGHAFWNDDASSYTYSAGDTHCAVGTGNTRAASRHRCADRHFAHAHGDTKAVSRTED